MFSVSHISKYSSYVNYVYILFMNLSYELLLFPKDTLISPANFFLHHFNINFLLLFLQQWTLFFIPANGTVFISLFMRFVANYLGTTIKNWFCIYFSYSACLRNFPKMYSTLSVVHKTLIRRNQEHFMASKWNWAHPQWPPHFCSKEELLDEKHESAAILLCITEIKLMTIFFFDM